MTTRLRAVTDEAVQLAISRILKAADDTALGGGEAGSEESPGDGAVLFGRRPGGTLSPMNVVVCVKQIPDPAEPGDLDPETKTLKREGKLILDESDSYGVEMALQLVDTAGEGEVTLISMAPNEEVSGLRTALAMGAAKAILVSDPALAGSDALTTAKVLAVAAKKVEGADLILTATESSDGYTGTVPEQLAAVLDLPSVTFAKEVEIADGTVKVRRQTEAGYNDVECSLPAVVSVTDQTGEARYPAFKAIMGAKKKPIQTMSLADLGVDAAQVGWSGASNKVVDVSPTPARTAGTIVNDDGTGAAQLADFLAGRGFI